MKIDTIWFAVFETPHDIETVKDIEVDGDTAEEALEEVFRRFNHAIPGETGDLAEKHGTRSLSVGDVVKIDGKFWQCAMVGWREIPNLNDMVERCHKNRKGEHDIAGLLIR